MIQFIRFARKLVIAAAVIALIGVGISWATGSRTLMTYGFTLIDWSIVVGILSIFAMGSNRITRHTRSPFISQDSVFIKWMANENPFWNTMISILAAAILDIIIGDLLTIFFRG
jgi:hypothetical protein